MFREFSFPVGDQNLNGCRGPDNGPPLLLLHGVTRRWQTFVPLLPSLVIRWQIFGLDFRGHGKSPRGRGYLVVDYVRDVVEIVKREFRQPVVLYGHSLGAMVVAGAAAELGEAVRAIVMEDPPFQTMGTRLRESTLHSYFVELQEYAGDTRDVGLIARDLADLVLTDPTSGKTTRFGSLQDAASLRFSASCLQRLDPRVLLPIVESRWLDGYDIEILDQIRCPALMIQAAGDCGGMLTDEDADRIESRNSHLLRIKIPGVGHSIHWTKTQHLLNLVNGFLESIVDRPS